MAQSEDHSVKGVWFPTILNVGLVAAGSAIATHLVADADLLPSGSSWAIAAAAGVSTLVVGFAVFAMGGWRSSRLMETLTRRLEAFGSGERGPSLQSLGGAIGPSFEQAISHAEQRERQTTEVRRELEVRCRVVEGERDRVRAVLDALRDGVIVTDAFDEVQFANDAAAHALGFDCRDAVHQPLSSLTDDPLIVRSVSEVRENSKSGATTKAMRRFEIDRPDPDRRDRNRTWEIRISPFGLDDSRGGGGVVMLVHDATRERELAQMKSDFVTKASHELRTPLSSIAAYNEMLMDGEATDEDSRREFYSVIHDETDRMGRLIDNMLNISRIEAGIMQIERQTVDMKDAMQRAVSMMEPQANEKSISLSWRCADIDLSVEGDRDMLDRVLINLISNAIKYTPEGGRVTVSADSDNLTRQVVVSINDTGLGIGPDDLDLVFDKFYRIDNYKRVAFGTGLGLSLCKHIVETLHQGAIGVESTLGMGSRFWISIPMQFAGSRSAA